MGLHNAVMYLQNVLVAIQMEINCKVRYSLFYAFIARTNILQMQKDYDEAQVKANYNQLFESPSGGISEDSKSALEDMEKTMGENDGGEDNFKYPLPDFPLTQSALLECSKF